MSSHAQHGINRKKIRTIAGCVIAFCAMVVALLWVTEYGIHKLVMPGTYRMRLDPGLYTIWYFWRWPSKGINSAEQRVPSLHIFGPDRRELARPLWPPTELKLPQFFLDRIGRSEFEMRFSAPGLYTFQSTEQCVFVVVPARNSIELGELDLFTGVFDDFNFDSSGGPPQE